MPGTPFSTSGVAVDKLDQWGLLIKSWATDLDYIDASFGAQPPRHSPIAGQSFALPSTSALPVPKFGGGTVTLPRAVGMSVAEFTQRVANTHQVTITVPAGLANVIVVQGDASTLVVRLPPKDMLQASEDELLKPGNVYPIPVFYDELYNGHRPAHLPTAHDDIMELHAYRIGEYTLNNCA